LASRSVCASESGVFSRRFFSGVFFFCGFFFCGFVASRSVCASESEIIHEQQAQKQKKRLTLCSVCAANLEIIPVINKIDLPGKSQVYLLYWYKSTNTDADAPGANPEKVKG
jgi:hypothetical protein